MIERLFKFSPIQYAEGLVSVRPWPAAIILLGLAVLVVVMLIRSEAPLKVRLVAGALRLSALALLAVPLMEPMLVTPTVVPNENFVAVLLDVSESMSLKDASERKERVQEARTLLYEAEGGLLAAIEEDFQVRLYTFAEQAVRVETLPALARGTGTDLSAALEHVMRDFRGLPLTGIVLLTDGADNAAPRAAQNPADALRARGIGLHIIGLGAESFAAERELLDVVVTKGVGPRTGAEIDVRVQSWGQESSPVTFSIFAGDSLVFQEDRALKGDGQIDQLSFFFEPPMEGAYAYRMAMEADSDEHNTRNNAQTMLVDAARDTLRVLYYEGHLRQDFKFIKRALEEDQVVDFTSISRTGTGKLYRQGVRSPSELAGGFPVDAAELYAFDALILGDVEASAFAPSQLRLMETFVRERGGGFLMMGGRKTFSEGVYVTGPIADMLPVYLDASRAQVVPKEFADPRRPSEEPQGFAFEPTAAGLQSPILKLSPEPEVNRKLWAGMPLLTSINYVGTPKAGAQVLAIKPDDRYGAAEPLLVVQRYGKGRAAAMTTSSSWRWQMLLEATDYRHERFWQQLTRWMAASAPDVVDVDLGQGHLEAGTESPIRVDVYDQEYGALEGAQVEGTVTTPGGSVLPLRFDEDLALSGGYAARITPRDRGLYHLEVVATHAGRVVGRQKRSFVARPDQAEFFDATLKRSHLERMAAHYYTPDEADMVPTNLRERRTSTSVFNGEYLWDMPALFILSILLLCAEWLYRRRQGLP